MSEIPELSLLEDIEELSAQYAKEFGAPPVNLSTWDPAPSVLNGMKLILPKMESGVNWIDYSFSYELSERPALLNKLGCDAQVSGCLVTHSGSSAITCVVSWLKSSGHKRVLILAPRYFSVPYALTALGIELNLVHLSRTPHGYTLPKIAKDVLTNCDAIWITNPVYCTSVDLGEEDKAQLSELVNQHQLTCIVDECLAEPGRYLGPMLAKNNTVISIYAPHKSVCVNGMKFGIIIFPKEYQRHFDSWSDVWNGCLPVSSVLAVRHFISQDFDRYRMEFKKQIAASHSFLRASIDKFSNLTIDRGADGYLISVFAPKILPDTGISRPFLREATWRSGATFIAGIRNELDPKSGLSFRVNLSAMSDAAKGGLLRLCAWLDVQGGDFG